MNEIKAIEYLQWLDEQIETIEPYANPKFYLMGKLSALKESRDKFKSLITKPYDPDHDSAV